MDVIEYGSQNNQCIGSWIKELRDKGDRIVNRAVLSRYLLRGEVPAGGQDHFFAGSRYPHITVKRDSFEHEFSYKDVLNVIRFTVREIVEEARQNGKQIVLMVTSGLDSRLLYYVLSEELGRQGLKDRLMLVNGSFSSYGNIYSELAVMQDVWPAAKSLKIDTMRYWGNDWENDLELASAVTMQPINGMVSVMMFRLYEYLADHYNDAIVINGAGDGVFLNITSSSQLNNRDIKYASDSSQISQEAKYLTSRARDDARKDYKVRESGCKTFDKYDRYIEEHILGINYPKVSYENFAYASYWGLDVRCPYYDSRLVSAMMSMDRKLIHREGIKKTAVVEMLRLYQASEVRGGLEVTSPQREKLYEISRVKSIECVNTSLVCSGIVDERAIRNHWIRYMKEFEEAKEMGRFSTINSYAIWKTVAAEAWIRGSNAKI